MTDELEPGAAHSATGDDETTRTRIAPEPGATPASVPPASATPVPPMTPVWDPVAADASVTPPWTPVAPTAPLTPASRPSTPDPVYENDVAWAVSAPVVADKPAARRRRSRMRWAAALAIVVLIAGTSAAVAAIITGRSAESTVLAYVPAQTTAYVEVRLDLPGDQRLAVGTFLQKFPGFKDQAALENKLDQVLDDLVKEATSNQQTYTGDIKPWFDGELAFSMGPLPAAASTQQDPTSAMAAFRALALISIKDPTAAQQWLDAAIAKSGATTRTEAYNGATLHLFDETSGVRPAYAVIDNKVIAIGDLVSVKAAVDTKGSGAFAKEPGPKAALDSVNGDHVGFAYTALRPLLDWSNQLNQSMAPQGSMTPSVMSAAMLEYVPDWAAYWLKFENDAVVMEATVPKADTSVGPTANRASKIGEHVPATAIVAATSNDLGKNLKGALDLYRAEPSFKSVVEQVDQALSLVGGEDAALGWAGDSAVVIDAVDGTPEGGLIVAPTDPASAQKLFTALRAFIAIGGGQQGITVRDETYNGTTITIVDLGDVSKLAGGGKVEIAALPLPSGNVEIAYAVTDDVVVIGSGPGFVKHVLDTTPSTSLASNDDYKKLIGRSGTGTGTIYADITAIRELAEKAMSASDPTAFEKYKTDIKPFLDPFDALIASGSVSGDLTKSTVIITVH